MKLNKRIKFLYGFGFSAQGIKDALFQLFLFFYFSQILGLNATYTGLATVIALLFDAVTDPWVGTLSDRWKSKTLGRRHPFMILSAFPLGLTLFLLFSPPENLDQIDLFLWLTVFSVLVRVSLTLFIVPGMSLGAELTDDYEERTSVTSYRVMFSSFVGPLILIFGLVIFFSPTEEFSNGLFNEAAYSKFALLCGVLATTVILISSYGTKSSIPNLPKSIQNESEKGLKSSLKNLKEAIKLPAYTSLVSYSMIVYIGLGIGTVLTTYFTTYFFELSERELAILPIASGLGGITSLFIAPLMGRFLDKKKSVVFSTLIFGLFFSLPFLMRLVNLFPENGSSGLLPAYLLTLFIAYNFLWVSIAVTNSMMADVVDEYQSIYNKRNEGFFFSTMSFAYKCTVGFGYFFAGVLLDFIAFPKQVTQVSEIHPEVINGLGIIGGPLLLLIYLSGIFFVMRYSIDKTRYLEIKNKIQN